MLAPLGLGGDFLVQMINNKDQASETTVGSILIGLISPVEPAPSLTNVLICTISSELQDPITRKVPTMLMQVNTAQILWVVAIDSEFTSLASRRQYQQVSLTYLSVHLILASISSWVTVVAVPSLLMSKTPGPEILNCPSSVSSRSNSPSESLREMTNGSMSTGLQMFSTSLEYPLPNLTKVLISEVWVDLYQEAIQRKVPTVLRQMKKEIKRSGVSILAWQSNTALRRQYQQTLLTSLSRMGTIWESSRVQSAFPSALKRQSLPQQGFSAAAMTLAWAQATAMRVRHRVSATILLMIKLQTDKMDLPIKTPLGEVTTTQHFRQE